ncbi:cation channel sperm-associated auxiliary subunit epsilon-like [Montipora foliosa]|uniref:cation channel sperm-associated auxiliary subunit epsilon-like n=1 Tax=Montipora foliosa TaxID=591990 RepID=UPI0035F10107
MAIFFRLALLYLIGCIHLASGKCPKHEALLHNFKPICYLDKRETIQLWAKIVPEPWEDNRLFGSISNTEYLTFSLTSWETSSEQQGIGVISRDINAVIRLRNKNTADSNRLSETAQEVSFAIKAFSEDTSCTTLKAETNITVGCPVDRHIFPRGKPSSCNGFQNLTFIVPRNQRRRLFLEDDETLDKLVNYDFHRLGCPFSRQKNDPFKPVIDLYDGETFVEEVDANYILWEQQNRIGFEYSATMKEAGCIKEAQSWEGMVKSRKGTNKAEAWSKQNYHSCFEDSASGPERQYDLHQLYEILNSSAASSHVVWNDVGVFIFTVKVIDQEFSFCNLTMEFAVQVTGASSFYEELPSFVTLGSSCLTIVFVVLSAYYVTIFYSA